VFTPLDASTSSNPVDVGWVAARICSSWRTENSGQGFSSLGLEVTVKVYGVAVTMPQGYSRVPNPSTGQQ
jgi:hypothetical protein